jgi:N6-L-threonylcarbamoyladenine synthase
MIANIKRPLPVKAGERGLRQSEAVFEHVRNLAPACEELSGVLDGYTPVAVGVSTRPRDAEGSYMPCFLSGKSAAYSFAAAARVTTYEFSHQNGHIMAALYSADKLDLLEGDGFYAFHVSGGTTEALLVRPRESGFKVELVGNTADINAGQAIDRVGVSMGIKFPCGTQLEALAAQHTGKIHRHAVCVRDGVCSLSGVENIANKLLASGEDRCAVAAFVFDFIGRTLDKMCSDIMERHGNRPVIFAGGVMSNKLMRERLSEHFEAYFSEPQFSADNAAGIALLARREYIYRQK